MKQATIFIATLVMSTVSLADSSGNLGARLGSAFKSYQTTQPQSTRNDLTIVYGGEDVANGPTLALRSTTV